ncbi:heterokaryon incompatibility protein-domain-containing protein [Lophiotrema nucula]|uniref:Heterokaryon incompatibility protein-domain-containing protein n=1 Tax=Lophiotrema nucula TaxID=690887 RepID=A0A6A5ZPL2_9PLEO|nr:heterokaryon incompatibility protein-domain-containing protein [Lophiotrema nucula]
MSSSGHSLSMLSASTFPPLKACASCKALFSTPSIAQQIFQTSQKNGGYKYQRKRIEVEESVAISCTFCKSILRPDSAAYEQGKEWQWEDLLLGVSRPSSYPLAHESLTCAMSYDPRNGKLHLKRMEQPKLGSEPMHFSTFATTTADDPMASRGLNLVDMIDRRSSESQALALSWLQQCKLGHPQCGPNVPTELPSRLVGLVSSGDSLSARLCLSEGSKGNYLALSYCWGGPQKYATTLGCIDEYKEQLPYEHLPATIRDAIKVTHSLGHRYIWIDALCIVQDSPADLNKELPKMKQTYQNADLTISVACADVCTEGFLNPQYNGFFRLPVQLDESTSGNILMNDQTSTWARGRGSPEPLNQRAWTLQESLLSKRLLIFPKRGIFYRCRAGCRSDNMKNPDWSFWAGRFGYRRESEESPLEELLLYPDDTKTKVPMPIVRRGWFNLVESYTERQLSVANDKLIAVSALAESLSHLFSCDYVAGLWRSDLIAGLCWQSYRTTKVPGRGSQRAERPTQYLAPSWSWASIMGPVQYNEYQMVPAAEILHVEVTLVSVQIPFGAVTDGILILNALVREVKLKTATTGLTSVFDPVRPEIGHTYLTTSLDIEHEEIPDIVLLLTLLTQPEDSDEKRNSGLILVNVRGSNETHRRVGWFDNYNDVGPLAHDTWIERRVKIV